MMDSRSALWLTLWTKKGAERQMIEHQYLMKQQAVVYHQILHRNHQIKHLRLDHESH